MGLAAPVVLSSLETSVAQQEVSLSMDIVVAIHAHHPSSCLMTSAVPLAKSIRSGSAALLAKSTVEAIAALKVKLIRMASVARTELPGQLTMLSAALMVVMMLQTRHALCHSHVS